MTAAAEVMLRWDAARGVGFLPVIAEPTMVYDDSYFDKYVGYANTDQGRAITAARVELVRRHAGFVPLCDIGIGCGSFVETYPSARGFDVNPGGIQWLLDHRRFADPYVREFDALTFWDALEHIAEPESLLANAREWVFVSAPIVPGDGPPSPDWKHFRPTEHCWYWTHQGLIDWMADYGFSLVESSDMETELGREDIGTFVFRRKAVTEPLRVALPLGIGDCCWVAMKLRALSKLHGGRPIEAYVNKSPDHASVGFLELCPQIARAVESDKALYHLHAELDEPYKSEKWSTLEGSKGWHGFDYILIANGHLESGKPLSSWMPELETEYSFELKIPEADRAYARTLAPVGSVLLYPSGIGANTGFHRNTWTVKHWAEVIRLLNVQGITPVLVGAASNDDKAYRDRLVVAARRLRYIDTIAKTNIPQVLAMIEDASVWCGLNSGLGIVSAMRQTPTLMLWADSAYPIRGSSTYTMHTAMQRSWLNEEQLKTYRTLSYGSPGLTAGAVVSNIMEIRRAA